MSGHEGLKGMRIAVFESRLGKTLCDLVRLHGGEPAWAPALKEVPLESNREAFLFAEKLFRGEIDVLILLTGVGTRALVQVLETRYSKQDVLEALRRIPVVPRGPKPVKVLKELGVPFSFTVPEPNTWRELLAELDAHAGSLPIQGACVAVQEYGVPNPELLEGLKERGGVPLSVPVYRWALPDDVEPLKALIRDIAGGKVQVAVFTTSVQVDHVWKVAETMGAADGLREAFKKMGVASVGPDCSRTLRACGLTVDIEPESPKMGPLVTALAEKAKGVLENKGMRL